ncbi:MAG: GNAT family N-acetyltransferase [Clostridiaceae bacterium]
MNTNLYRADGKLVYIKKPEFYELQYVQELWNDEETMEGIGGVFNFPEERWKGFYKKMISPSDGKNFYCLVYNMDDIPVGEVGFHGYDSAVKLARLNIKIQGKYRGRGYGKEAIRLLLEYFFLEFGGNIIMERVNKEYSEEFISSFGGYMVSRSKGDVTYQITKESFLTLAKTEKKNVCCLIYQGVDLTEISLTFDLFNLINRLNDKEIFRLYTVGNEAVLSNGLKVMPSNGFDDSINPNVIIVPGGIYYNEDKEICSYINKFYENSDYLLATGHGIITVAACGLLKRNFAVALKEDADKLKEISPSTKLAEKIYADAGKVITATGGKSSIEAVLKIIRNMLGTEKAKELEDYLNI